jgi:hypothetical protein
MNFFNKKTQRKIVAAVALLCVILMVVSLLAYIV